MLRPALLVVLAASLLSLAPAQQPNQVPATLRINGFAGPPFPIIGVPAFGGTTAIMDVLGGANVPLAVFYAPGLRQPGLSFLNELVDLDLSDPLAVVPFVDGFFSGISVTTSTAGIFTLPITLAASISPSTQAAFQGVVADPAAPFAVHLTAASSIFAHPGLTSINFNLGDDNCAQVNTFIQWGIQIPFYGSTYDSCFVCANGYVTFGSASTGFTPSLPQMHGQQPRIAMFWCDLDPTQGGSISLTVNQINPANPTLTFKYKDIRDWPVGVNGGIGLHTFGARIDIASGDVDIRQCPTNANSNYDILVGMGSGGGLDPTGAGGMDLSATFAQGPYIGQVNEGFYEGFRGVTSITGTFPPGQIYDLAGNYWRMSAVGAGAPGALYIMNPIPAGPCP